MKYSSKQYALGLYAALSDKSVKNGLSPFAVNEKDVLSNFVRVLKNGKDVKKIRFIEEELKKAEYEKSGEMEVIVWTGMLISSVFQKKIKKFIADFFKKDMEKIKAVFEIDKNLIGGFKARAGDYLIDASVKGMLSKLKKNII